jgi:hypothetical protein
VSSLQNRSVIYGPTIYRHWVDENIAKGELIGIAKGVLAIVGARFPLLGTLAEKKLKGVQDEAQLEQILVAMSTASDEQAAKLILNDLSE